MAAHLPQGTLVAIAGGKDIADPAAVIARLDHGPREIRPTSSWCTAAAPASRSIAAQWAERNGVHQIVCKPDWNRHGRAAPFRRNEELLNLLPKGVIAFPGSGITENLVDKCKRQLGIPVMKRRCLRSQRHRGPRRHPPGSQSGAGGGAARFFDHRNIVAAATSNPRARFDAALATKIASTRRPRQCACALTAARCCRRFMIGRPGHEPMHFALPRRPRPPSVVPTLPDAAASSTRVDVAVGPRDSMSRTAGLAHVRAKPPAHAPRRLQSAGSSGVDFPIHSC